MPPGENKCAVRSVSVPPRVLRLPGAAWVAAGLLLLALYLGFLVRHGAYFATDADASGYFNAARQLRDGPLVGTVRPIAGLPRPGWNPYYQQPLGYRVDPETGRIATSYPVGYPLHLLVAGWFVGLDRAARVVNLGLTVAAALLMIGLGREFGLSSAWSAAGAALLLCCPLFVIGALQPMSDMPATVWCMATLWLALRARGRPAWTFGAGVALGVAVLVRPSDLLLAPVVAIVLGGRWRAGAAFIAGGVPAAAFLAWYNHTLYASAVASGYGPFWRLFRFEYAGHNALHFGRWMRRLLSPAILLPALALPLVRGQGRRHLLLAAWAAVILGFYLFYYHSGETWWYLRFILPMFPAVILAALIVGQAVTERWRRGRPWIAAVALAVLAFALGSEATLTHRLGLAFTSTSARPYLKAVGWMRALAPADAIVVQMQLSGSFAYYTNFTLARWDLMTPAAWTALRSAARAAGRPIYATLFDFEETEALARLPGDWKRVARLERVDIWELPETAR